MKITAIRAWQIDLPLHEGKYSWSGGNSVSVFDSTIVGVETDTGLTGWAKSARSVRRIWRRMPTVHAPGSGNWRRSSLAQIRWRSTR